MAVVRPPFVRQGDGSTCQWANCGLASHCMAIWRHLEGLNPEKVAGAPWPPTPSYLRYKLGKDGCPGTSLNPDGFFLASEYYGAQLEYRYDLPFEEFKTLIRSGRGAVVRIDYSPVHGTAFDSSPRFYGTHQVFVNQYYVSSNTFLVGDPLASGFKAWPASLLRDAAGVATGEVGLVDANFTRDTEGQMIRITDEIPMYLTAPVGKWFYFTDGTKFRQTTSKIAGRLSPYGTTVNGVDYRIVRGVADGLKYVLMMAKSDVSLRA